MAPKKAGKKKDEVQDIPKASTLPDGVKEYFIGGWSSLETMSGISTIAEAVRPKREEDEAAVAPTTIYVLPGDIGSNAVSEEVVVSHRMTITGLTPKTAAAQATAFDNSRRVGSGGAEGDEGAAAANDANAAAEGEDDGAAQASSATEMSKRKIVLVEASVRIQNAVSFIGTRPTVTVQPILVEEKKSAAPTKGKKVSEEDKLRELEERRQRDEAAVQAAKEEEERLNKFAIPQRWASVTIDSISFHGRVSVAQCHVTFKNCAFVNAAVEITQYARVQFVDCLFSQPASNALYCYPLSEVVVRGCVFSGLPPPSTVEEATAAFATAAGSTPDIHTANASVGVHADGAKITVEKCSFEFIGTAVLLRGRYQPTAASSAVSSSGAEGADAAAGDAAAAASSGAKKQKLPTSQSIFQCDFDKIYVAALLLDAASGVAIKKNTVGAAGYYGLRVVNGGKQQLVMGNKFASKVSIGRGSFPTLHTNVLDVPLEDVNNTGNVYMEPTY